jgi:probable HAF family extracellular repeat protein
MKSRITILSTAATLLAALAMPIVMAAQDNTSPNHHRHHQYRLFDVGTFGGPASYLTTSSGVGLGARVLNNQGVVIGGADTTLQDPYCGNPDCFLSQAFRYENGVLTNLGALVDGNGSGTSGINERGWIVGASGYGVIDPYLGVPAGHAALWTHGGIADLGTLGGYESNAILANDAGEIDGISTIDGPIDPYSFLGQSIHGFIWRNGVMRDVGTLGGPDTFTGFARQPGVVVGGSFTNSIPNPTTGIPTLHPFLWKNGHMQDLGTLGGTACCLLVVANSHGQVTGDSNLAGDQVFHPFLWSRGRLTDLGTLGGDTGQANDINDAGDIVGVADLPDGGHDGFLWRNGRMTDLGNLGATSNAHALNSKRQVVGASRMADGITLHAFLWENGGPIVDLNDLIPQNSRLQLIRAENINERGEIAGIGVPAGCEPVDEEVCGHAYLLVPDGDCDNDCEQRIANSQAEAELRRQSATSTTKPAESQQLTPAERFRSMIRQRLHLPGSRPVPRD